MIDYKKAEQAYELLKQSNVPFMVAFENEDGESASVGASGNYSVLRGYLIQLIAQIANGVREAEGKEAALKELQNTFMLAGAMLFQKSKEDKECQTLN